MSTTGTVLATRLFSALRASTVATQAGVAAGTWADTTVPHVFSGSGPYVGGRNRGRLPFVEFEIQSQPFTQEHPQGGTMHTTVRIWAHCGGRDLEVASNLLEAILAAGLQAMRDETTDNYMCLGSETMAAMQPGPWGHSRSVDMTVEHSYDRTTYEVQ